MSNPISPESRRIVDRILADHAANPGHDMACLLCGATYVNAAGHVCDVSATPAPPEMPDRSGYVAAVREALGRLVRRTNRTSIPVQDTDEDVIVARALDRLEKVEKENLERADEIFRRKNQVYELRARVADLEAAVERVRGGMSKIRTNSYPGDEGDFFWRVERGDMKALLDAARAAPEARRST